MNNYTVGDTVSIRATLYKNGAVEDITGYTIKGAIVGKDMKTLALGSQIVNGIIYDAANGIVDFTFPKTDTDSILPGDYWLEIQAEVLGTTTTYDRVMIHFYNGAIA